MRSEEYSNFKPFPPETKLEHGPPSELHEILQETIPFESRVAYLVPYVYPELGDLDFQAAADKLELSRNAMRKYIEKVGALDLYPEDERGVLPHSLFEVIEAERDWDLQFSVMDEVLTIEAVKNILNMSRDWVKHTAAEIGEYAIYPTTIKGHDFLGFDKSVIEKLRHIIMYYPPDGDWFNVSELVDATQRSWRWIEPRLIELGINAQKRRSSLNEHVYDYYPPEVVEMLRELSEKVPPAGNWLTIRAISLEIKRTKQWINARISEYENQAELRLDDGGNSRLHFPPEVVEMLRELSEKVPPAGNWLSVRAISKQINKTEKWVYARIGDYEDQAELRLDVTGRAIKHYPPIAVEKLQQEAERIDNLEAQGIRLSISGLARLVGKNRMWVKTYLPTVNATPEVRRDSMGREVLTYDPDVVKDLVTIADFQQRRS